MNGVSAVFTHRVGIRLNAISQSTIMVGGGGQPALTPGPSLPFCVGSPQ